MDSKLCAQCSLPQAIDFFHKDRSRVDGRSRYCKDCKRTRDHENYVRTADRRREAQKAAYKRCQELLRKLKGDPCADCGQAFPHQVMQFDHPDPRTKRTEVSNLVSSGSLRALLAEVAKCDLVCSNCHIMRTVRQVEAGLVKLGRPRKVA